jgi:expansin (peptidoglycan-binding protein)
MIGSPRRPLPSVPEAGTPFAGGSASTLARGWPRIPCGRYVARMHRPLSLALLVTIAGCGGAVEATDASMVDAGPRPDTGPRPDGGSSSCSATPIRTGDGTYYDGDGTGNCSFDARPDMLFAAMNDPDYDGSDVCGTCAEVTGPNGTITVTITDRCPECASGDLDLSVTAFDAIADHAAGRVPITWHEVPCAVTGPVVFHVYEGSNPYYLAIIVENAQHRVVSVERETTGGWAPLARQDYDVWIESPVDDAPITTAHLRATDVHGDVVEADVPVTENTDTSADRQFAACAP